MWRNDWLMSNRSSTPRARVGLVGLGGYAGEICKLLRRENAEPLGRTRLVAGFAPDPQNHGPLLEELARENVRRHETYAELLGDSEVDAIWLPVPIGLHRPMAEAALKAGKSVMIEKPVAGCIDDHDAIARAADASDGRVLIGFQDVYRPSTLMFKRRLLAGDFGTPTKAAVLGLWPRDDAYYARNGWAGRIRVGNAWVLDSPLNNAMAHYVNLALFLLGSREAYAAQPTRLEAALWRGRASIENFDTCALRVELQDAAELTVVLSHAVAESHNPRLEIDTDRGTLRVAYDGRATFEGEQVHAAEDGRHHMARALGAAALGEASHPAATLASSRPHTLIVSAASQVAPIEPLAVDRNGEALFAPGRVEAALRSFHERDSRPMRDAMLPATVGVATGLDTYNTFAGPASAPGNR